MYSAVGIRQGFVKIRRDREGRFELTGLPVLGRGTAGELINRTIRVSKYAPEWFYDLCNRYADTPVEVEVAVKWLAGNNLAYATPVAEDAASAVKHYVDRHPEEVKVADAVQELPVDAYDKAFQAHEFVCAKQKLEVVCHYEGGMKTHTIAKNSAGKQFRVSGGMLLNKIANYIASGKTTWEHEAQKFVRVRPI